MEEQSHTWKMKNKGWEVVGSWEGAGRSWERTGRGWEGAGRGLGRAERGLGDPWSATVGLSVRPWRVHILPGPQVALTYNHDTDDVSPPPPSPSS